MKIVVDESKCVGSGNCLLNSPGHFGQSDETGLVILLNPEPNEKDIGAVEAAVNGCPTGALSLV